MASYPSLPLWTDAYMADTGHLSFEEHGVYMMLLMTIWRSPNCRIPNDMKWIQRRLRASQTEMDMIVEPIVKEFFDTSGNWITQKRLKQEYNYVSARSKSQSDRAKLRWQKEKDVCQRNATAGIDPAMPPHPHPHLEIDTSYLSPPISPPRGNDVVEDPKPKSKRPKRSTLPADWEPNEHAAEIADTEGYTNDERSEILQQFRDYAGANNAKYADWHKAFYNWLRSDITKRFVRERRRGIDPVSAGTGRGNASLASTVRNLSVVGGS